MIDQEGPAFSTLLTKHRLWVVDGTPTHYRESGTQRWDIIDGTGNGIGAEGHQVGQTPSLQRTAPVTLANELRASRRIELHSGVLIDPLPTIG